ncbi:MAG: hypothetical protein N4A35_15155 [Flavobacteriales bacterium]|jgi:hypothetical protein|nr:hypothetical protein [Flavobacteriales bacterium]
MLTVKNVNRLIENHLKKNYHPKVFDKHFEYYLLVFEELLRLYSSDVGLTNEHGIKRASQHGTNFGYLEKFDFKFHYRDYKKKFKKRIRTKFLNEYHDYDCVDINLLNVIKRDLIELGILVKTRRSQPISEKVFTGEQFTLELMPGKQLFQNEEVEFEYRGDFKRNYNSEFTFEIQDLMTLSKGSDIKPRRFLQNYFMLMKMNDEGFKIKHIESNGRKHNSLSRSGIEFRNIVTPQNGNWMENYDIKSSHPFWLAVLCKSKELYKDIKEGRLYSKYKKETIREWMNSQNFEARKYNGINELFFVRYGIDTSLYRDKKGSLYETLATLESDYVQGISEDMLYANYTMHDQIHFDHQGKKEFNELVKKRNRELQFEPIWVAK